MGMGSLVEYLASLKQANSVAPLLGSAIQQNVVALFPPGATIALATSPAPAFAAIGFRGSMNAGPGDFDITINLAGHEPITGILTEDFIRMGWDYFLVSTQTQEVTVTMTSNSALFQRFESNFQWLRIMTSEDFEYAYWAIRRYGFSQSMVDLFTDIARSLRRMEALDPELLKKALEQ